MKYLNKLKEERAKQARRFYNSKQWRVLRLYVLEHTPLCVMCEANGILTPATEVDHIVPIMVNPALIDSLDNLQALCHQCHSRKTFEENKAAITSRPKEINIIDNILNDIINNEEDN